MKNRTSPITHILYDLDGLLLDTEPFYTQATQAIVGQYGHTFDWSIKSRMIGKKAIESARILVDTLKLPISPDDYLRERAGMLAELFPRSQPMPGAQRLTHHLAGHGVPQGVATSSNQREFQLKISRHATWFAMFQCIVLGDDPDVRHGKPAPDIFLIAAARLKAEPERCLVFEDAPAGVEAGRAAGMSVVAVPNPGMSHDAYGGADQILPSLESFDPVKWGLPPFTSAV